MEDDYYEESLKPFGSLHEWDMNFYFYKALKFGGCLPPYNNLT